MMWNVFSIAAAATALLSWVTLILILLHYRRVKDRQKALSIFWSSMGHDIRNPLFSIITLADLLQDSTLSAEERQQHTRAITLSGNTLLNLVNNILDYAKLEAGKLQIIPAPTNFSLLCEETKSLFSGLIIRKGLCLKIEKLTEMPVVRIDSQRVRQILVNLVSNAINFTDYGTIAVETSFKPLTASHGILTFSVIDSGRGIPEEIQKRIFEPFMQNSPTPKGTSNGTGLGLAITMELIRKMHGKITLSSQTDKGSRFTVIFPETEFLQT